MNDDSLIKAISGKLRYAKHTPAPHVSDAAISEAERVIGTTLPPLYCRLLREVGNGGFGPGLGLIGLRASHNPGKHDALSLRAFLWSDDPKGPPVGVLPLCDWGDAMWSCMDAGMPGGEVLSLEGTTIMDTGETLSGWLEGWVSDAPLLERMQRFDTVESMNPFTKQPVRRRRRLGLSGKRYTRR